MNWIKFLLNFVALLSFLTNPDIFSKEKFKIEASVGLDYNHYNANFNGFPGYDCCGHFTNGKGLGYSIAFTGFRNNFFSLSNLTLNFFSSISFTNIPGKFEQKDYFADVIIDNNIYKAISLHTIETNIYAIALKPGVELSNIFGSTPVNIQLGTSINIPLKASFQQKEELLSPENAYFENNQKVRNNYSGDIKNFRNPFVGLELTLGWKFKIRSDYYFKPYLTADIPLHNFVKNINWKANRISFGIAVGYHVASPKAKPPVIPPLFDYPEPTMPPVREPIDAEIIVYDKGTPSLSSSIDTIKISKITKRIVELFPIPTIIFYNRNDYLFGEEAIESSVDFEKLFEENRIILASILDYLKTNPQAKISLYCSQSNDEIANICSQRLARLSEYFIKNGFGDRLDKQSTIIPKHTKNIPELLAEERFVRIVFDDGSSVVYTKRDIETDSNFVLPKLQVEIKCKPEVETKISSEIIFRNNNTVIQGRIFDLEISEINFTSISSLDSIIIKTKLETTEEYPRTIEKMQKIYIKANENNIVEYRYSAPFDGENYILVGLFPLDSDEPYWTHPLLSKLALDLSTDGKKVSIIGSVDNIGSEEHNQKLALRRAAKINQILKSGFPIKIMDASNRLNNGTPLQRLLNRSAWLFFEN
ncbi:MAG: hypothetical protein ACK42Z_03470 [Candidatus Kapaibacteriota bacterium]